MEIKESIHPICKECLKRTKNDWYVKNGKVFSKDKTKSGWDTQICTMIHDEMKLSKGARRNMTPEDIEFVNLLHDPTKWADAEMDWKSRWYQDIMLKCTAFRKVSRCGRRVGKTEALCANMLHYAYTYEDIIILVIAPYKNQVGLIFDKLDSMLGNSHTLKGSINRNTKNPYRIQLHNKSKILGFTSGTRTGGKSVGIRGQDAHMILIDEADYLSESDFEVILAIQASRPDVKIWASSTPTGRRDMFWRFCTDQELGFKEFHFPSSVSPSWTPQVERLEKAQYSEHGYAHEFEAEFGDEAEGVFMNKYIDNSLSDYDMSKLKNNKHSIYTMGIDWNTSGNGTVIIITEWNTSLNGGRGAFRLVRKSIITQEEFTQVRACEKIIEMNAEWDPAAIYVDQGFGHVQIEMLRKYGMENLHTGLVQRVKGIYFGDRIEIRDPVSKQKVKKHIKSFIVNLAVRRMEDGQIMLPESEDIKNGLVGQMRDYTVIRRTALGQPIYSDENEHSLIAWMLSIFAATMEFSDFTAQNRIPNVGITGRFGEKQEKEFVQNRSLVEKHKREKHTVVPRWPSQSTFQESTSRSSLDLQHKRSKEIGKKSSNGKLLQKRLNKSFKSRAEF